MLALQQELQTYLPSVGSLQGAKVRSANASFICLQLWEYLSKVQKLKEICLLAKKTPQTQNL